MRQLAWVLSAVLAALAALHLYWVAGGRAGRAVAVPSRPDGARIFAPKALATALVAAALLCAAAVVLLRARAVPVPAGVPARPIEVAAWMLAAVFAARAVGDFRYVGLFKRVRATPFARWDTRLFTPLCLALAGACALVAAS
jgi:hypothetical protein